MTPFTRRCAELWQAHFGKRFTVQKTRRDVGKQRIGDKRARGMTAVDRGYLNVCSSSQLMISNMRRRRVVGRPYSASGAGLSRLTKHRLQTARVSRSSGLGPRHKGTSRASSAFGRATATQQSCCAAAVAPNPWRHRHKSQGQCTSHRFSLAVKEENDNATIVGFLVATQPAGCLQRRPLLQSRACLLVHIARSSSDDSDDGETNTEADASAQPNGQDAPAYQVKQTI